MSLNSKIGRYAAIAVFGAMALLIICTFKHYGITWDEELQNQYGLAVADYYLSRFQDTRFDQIFNLYLYGGMFDGFAALVNDFTPFDIYDTRHLLNALFGLLGLWGTWKLGRFLGKDAVGFLAVVLCASTPAYYGHIFNNPKDIPFAAGIVWSIYHMSRIYAKPSRMSLIKLAIVLGLTLGVRVGGAMVFAYWLAPMGVVTVLPLWKNRGIKTLRAVFHQAFSIAWRIVLPVGILSYVIMLLCWPWAQQAPLSNPLRALGEFSNFPQDVEVLLDGTTYRSTELPWYYVPLYFVMQLPEILLFLLGSFFLFFPNIWKSLSTPRRESLALILLMAFVPILYAVFRHPALYDAVRHFTFVIPLASCLAALAAKEIFGFAYARIKKAKIKHATVGILGLVFFAADIRPVLAMIELHPYEYIFANVFAGGTRGAYGRYESDYWGSSFKEAAEEIQAYVAKEGGVPPGKIYKIAICGPWSSAMIYMPPDYEPVIANEPAEFFLSTTRWMCQNMRPGKEIVRIERDGVPLSIVKDLRDGYAYYEGNAHEKKPAEN